MRVVDLSEYRKNRARRPRHAATPDLGAVYYCKRCGADHFVLRAAGEVHCAGCAALMSNVVAVNPARSGERGNEG